MATLYTERRDAPRYPADSRLFASIDGRTVVLRNISLSGVAVHARGLTIGSLHTLEIHLNRHHLAATVKILDTSDKRLLHACFVDLHPHTVDLISEYIRSLG